MNENPDLFADEWDARRYHAPIALSEPEQIANEHWDLMDRVALDGDDIKRLLERLWEDWEPVTLPFVRQLLDSPSRDDPFEYMAVVRSVLETLVRKFGEEEEESDFELLNQRLSAVAARRWTPQGSLSATSRRADPAGDVERG